MIGSGKNDYQSICKRARSRISSETHARTRTDTRAPAVHGQRTDGPPSGSGPGSDDVLYHYNLLRSILPTAVLDDMLHPLRADPETALLLPLSNTPSSRGTSDNTHCSLLPVLRGLTLFE